MHQEEIVQMHAVFRGQVQGVGFRYTTRMLAQQLGLKGTVRNDLDGSVELYAQGKKTHLESLLKDLETQFDLDLENSCSIAFSACDSDSDGVYKDFSVIF